MIIPCPECPKVFEVSDADPDATLSDLWEHLYEHAPDHDRRKQLFIKAQEQAA